MLNRRSIALILCLMPLAALAQTGGPDISFDTLISADGVPPGGRIRAAVEVTVPEPWHVNAHEPLDDYLIPTALSLDLPEGFSVTAMAYPEPKEFSFQGSEDIMLVYGGTFHIGAEIEVAESVAPDDYEVPGTVKYQACNDTQCWAPAEAAVKLAVAVVPEGQETSALNETVFAGLRFEEEAAPQEQAAPDEERSAASGADAVLETLDRFEVTAQAGGYMDADTFLAFLDRAETGETQRSFLADKSLWFVALVTLVGGLLLNLTPCVLPIIPINLAIIGAGSQAGSRGRGFALGLMYGVGIALVYGALGLIVVLGISSFGTINASPWFNFAIAVIFILLGLALFDVFLIDFTRFQSKLGVKKEQGSFLFALIMGMVNALLAGACVAPVVIMVMLYSQDAYAKGSPVGLVLPFLLGVGMALPWPLAGAGLSLLPKPGKWMVYVKYAFGAFIIAMGAYYGYLGYTLFSGRYLVDREAVQASVAVSGEEGWYTSLDEALAESARTGQPVLLDFWATWCKNCLTMNKTTLKDPAVISRLENYVKVKYQAEQPTEPPASDVLSRFDEYFGLPHYAVLEPPATP